MPSRNTTSRQQLEGIKGWVSIDIRQCAQQIDQQSALQTSQKEKNERIPFTLTYHPHNLAAKNIILKNFKLLQNDNETGRIFSQPPLVSFKRDKNIGNFLVRSVLKSDDQPGTFKMRAQTMQHLSFHSRCVQNNRTQAID